MRRLILAALFAAALAVGTLAGTAYSADEHAPHGEAGHTHHVHKGNGECEDIDEHNWEGGDRGMHRAGNESGAMDHGTCASHAGFH